MEPNGITRVRCNLYRFNEETLGEPVTVRVFENFPHEWPRRAGISSSSSFEIQDTRPSPFTRGFLSFRANLFSFSQVFPFPCKWKSIPPRILLFFSFKKKNPIATGKLTKKILSIERNNLSSNKKA